MNKDIQKHLNLIQNLRKSLNYKALVLLTDSPKVATIKSLLTALYFSESLSLY